MSMINLLENDTSGFLADLLEVGMNLTGSESQGPPKMQNGTHSNRVLPPTCYVCNVACIYKSIELVFILGVLTNLTVIFCVIRDKRLHRPTYVTLACLALADAAFLSFNLTISIDVVIKAFSCASFRISELYFPSLVGTCWCAANGHLTLLSVVRYLMLVHPLKAHIHLTVRRVILSSGLVWFVSACLFTTRGILLAKSIISAERSEEIVLIAWCVSYLIPFLITATLHMAKLRKVRKATKDNTTVYRQTELSRMSRIIIIVLILAFVLPIPKLINEMLLKSGINIGPRSGFLFHFHNISIILFLLNSGINPLIYAFMSPAIRRSLATFFKCFTMKERLSNISSKRLSSKTLSSTNSPCAVRTKKILATISNPSSIQSSPETRRNQRQIQEVVNAELLPDDNDYREDDAKANSEEYTCIIDVIKIQT